MEDLKNNSHLNIQEVADKTGYSRIQLRDMQLEFLRKYVKRDSPLWEVPSYGRTE